MVLAILAALQTREELAEEILAAARATEARGSYEIRLDQTSSQAMGAGGQEHAIEVRMDATGAWQSLNLWPTYCGLPDHDSLDVLLSSCSCPCSCSCSEKARAPS